jgi:large subunit ribosomal protein L18
MARTKQDGLRRRHLRVRRTISGTPQRPRLCIHRSLKHLYVQVIDDTGGRTLCAATTNTKAIKGDSASCGNRAFAEKLGAELAAKARECGIEKVVFDRGGYRFHGVVKAFADAARAGGLKF